MRPFALSAVSHRFVILRSGSIVSSTYCSTDSRSDSFRSKTRKMHSHAASCPAQNGHGSFVQKRACSSPSATLQSEQRGTVVGAKQNPNHLRTADIMKNSNPPTLLPVGHFAFFELRTVVMRALESYAVSFGPYESSAAECCSTKICTTQVRVREIRRLYIRTSKGAPTKRRADK